MMSNSVAVVAARLVEQGFRSGVPPWVSAEEAEVDRTLCGLAPCTACRHKGLDFLPFFRWKGRAYRVVAVCQSCGHARECGEGAPVEAMLPVSLLSAEPAQSDGRAARARGKRGG
jgi:hypothetical protein